MRDKRYKRINQGEIHCPSTRDNIKKEKRKYRGRKSSEK